MSRAAPDLPGPFQSQADLEQAFIAGLERQLDAPSLGAYILVLANASFDAGIWPRLAPGLAERFRALAAGITADLRAGRQPQAPDDDLMVFLKLMAMGFDAVGTTEFRRAGPWELQYNPLRALRPARASGLQVSGCRPPAFNGQGFHFNKAFLQPEILWEGRLGSHDVRLLYNKFPFAPLHTLLVPEPEREQAQLLTQELHHYAWHLAESLGPALPGIGIAYNSYGAHASVNHLHFQLYARTGPLPMQDPGWRHNGGETPYPLECRVFSSGLEAWFYLEHLNQGQTPYNLVYLPGRLYCLPRRAQGSHALPDWTAGFAWHELAGGITTFRRHDFDGLTATAIGAELARLDLGRPGA
jgi:diadenosine tetraphosphate (Ap4A) HIT family hydrolase